MGTGRELLPFTCRLELSSVHHPASDLLPFAASLHNPLTTTCCSFLLCCYWKGLFTNNCRHWFLYLYFFQLLFLTVSSHELSNYHRIGWTLEWSYCLIPVHYNCCSLIIWLLDYDDFVAIEMIKMKIFLFILNVHFNSLKEKIRQYDVQHNFHL